MRLRYVLIFICLLVAVIPVHAAVTGTYRVVYKDVTELTDTLQLDFADTISNATVTFSVEGVPPNFDNSGGGIWTKWAGFKFVSAPLEYAQYKVEISGTNWYLYNVTGGLVGSGAVTDFWTLVNSTGADIRVFDNSGQLYFWIEDFSSTAQTATIWVNVSSGSSELNIAYGNPDALPSSYNNPLRTFVFFDDFSDGDYTNNPAWTVESGTWFIKNVNGKNWLTHSDTVTIMISSNMSLTSTGFVVEAEIMRIGSTTDYGGDPCPIMLYDSQGRFYAFKWAPDSKSGNICNLIYNDGSTTTTLISSTHAWATNTPYKIKIVRDQNGKFELYVDGTLKGTATDTSITNFVKFKHQAYDKAATADGGDAITNIRVYKLADPADVSSFQTGYFYVQNPRLILNGNIVEYIGKLVNGNSVTLAVNSTYFVLGANNVTLTSDNKAPMDVILEFDYAFSVSTTVIDKINYIWKNSTVTIPAGTVSATFSQLFPQRTNDYRILVLKNGTSVSYTSSADGTNIKVSIDLTEGTYNIDEKVAYLVVNIVAKDEETLSTLSAFNVTVREKKFSTTSGHLKLYGDDVDTTDFVRVLVDAADYSERGYVIDFSKFEQQLTAYLLKTLSGSEVTFTVMNSYGTALVNAKVTARKLLEGTYAVVDEGLTDFAGSISLFLKPYDTYQISVSADGYSPVSYEIEINKLNYYVYLGSAITVDWSKVNTNVYYSLEPRFIDPNANTTIINFTIYSKDGNLEYATLTLKYNGTVLFTDTILDPSGGQIKADITSAVANATSGFVIAEIEFKVGGEVFKQTRTIYIMGSTGLFPTLKNFKLEGLARIIVACFSTLIIVALLARVVPGFGTGIVALIILGFFTLAGWFDPWLFMLSAMVVIALYVIMR